jgi:hypothetical protein
MIRQHFALEQFISKLDEKPLSVQGGKDITHDSSAVIEVKRPSHLKRVK